MWHDDYVLQFNFTFSQHNLFDETTTVLDISSTRDTEIKKEEKSTIQSALISKDDQIQEQQQKQLAQRIDILEQSLHDMKIYEEKLIAFCGLWEDYPHHRYRMKFCIEMGQLVGYSNINDSK
ncbi:unnamed protein product, partial [Rotaria sordida]